MNTRLLSALLLVSLALADATSHLYTHRLFRPALFRARGDDAYAAVNIHKRMISSGLPAQQLAKRFFNWQGGHVNSGEFGKRFFKWQGGASAGDGWKKSAGKRFYRWQGRTAKVSDAYRKH